MRSNPEPHDVRRVFHGERSIVQPRSRQPKTAHFLELDRGMPGVLLPPLMSLVRPLPNFGRKSVVTTPESRVGAMPYRSVQRPCRKSSSASSAGDSSRPAATSSSIRRSRAFFPINESLSSCACSGGERNSPSLISPSWREPSTGRGHCTLFTLPPGSFSPPLPRRGTAFVHRCIRQRFHRP